MMYDFYLYRDKGRLKYEDLQKCSLVAARLCKHLAEHKSQKRFFDNCFTTLALKMKGIRAVGPIRANCSNKDLEKAGRSAFDDRSDSNSGLIVAKWVDNKIVEPYFNNSTLR